MSLYLRSDELLTVRTALEGEVTRATEAVEQAARDYGDVTPVAEHLTDTRRLLAKVVEEIESE